MLINSIPQYEKENEQPEVFKNTDGDEIEYVTDLSQLGI